MAIVDREAEQPNLKVAIRRSLAQRLSVAMPFPLIGLLGFVLVVLIVAGQNDSSAPLSALHILLGASFVLLVPGYFLQAALFPRPRDLDLPERLALSFGLSIAVAAPTALILDALPLGIRLLPIGIALGTFTVASSAIALARRAGLAAVERGTVVSRPTIVGWWRARDRTKRVTYSVVAGAVLTAIVATTAVFLLSSSGERYTEFYMLGSGGLAEESLGDVVAGAPATVKVGITNQEGIPATYHIKVESAGRQIGEAGPITLDPSTTDVRPLSFVPAERGDDVEIEILLYRDGGNGALGSEPYRSLRLCLKVGSKG